MSNIENKTLKNSDSKQLIELEESLNKTESPKEKARILLELGLIESFRKNYDKSIEYIEESQKFYNEIKDIKKRYRDC